MQLNLNNKRVLITGSSRGIGLSIAKGFLNEGATIILSSRNQEDVDYCRQKLLEEDQSYNIFAFACDFTNQEDVFSLKQKIVEKLGGLDIVIANVGSGKSVVDSIPNEEQFDKVFSCNFNSALYTARAFYSEIKKLSGNFIFITSIVGLEAYGAPTDYAVGKSAVIAFSKNLARKVAVEGVRVNCIAPGNILFKGGNWDDKIKLDANHVKSLIDSTVPMQRFGTLNEVSDSVLFLSSDRASFITGIVLVVDGGQTVGVY